MVSTTFQPGPLTGISVLGFVAPNGTDVIPVSAANPLPSGGGGGGGSSIADSLVVDAVGVYWILQDQGAGTFVYYKLSTLVVGTPTAPVVPAAGSNGIQIIEQKYTATAAATGYAIGDILNHVLVVNINTNPPAISQSTWLNITQGTVLAGAPSPADINPIDDNVNATIVGTLPAFAATPTVNVGTMPNVTISGTVPISAASLPLPTGAATSTNQTANTTAITNMAAQLPASLGQKAPAASMSTVSAGRTLSAYPLSMNGSSQTLVTAGQAATYLFVYNPVGNGSVTLNLAGAAAVAGSGVVLPAGASFELAGGVANAVTAIGTNAQTLICFGGA